MIIDVPGVGKVKSWYLSSRELGKLGQETVCRRCETPFIMGKQELHDTMMNDFGKKPKMKLELHRVDDEIVDLNLNHTPIDTSQMTMQELAILYGLQTFTTRFCPSCFLKNQEESHVIEYNFDIAPTSKMAPAY